MAGGTSPSPPSDSVTEQAALWWHETDAALQAGHFARAKRFLRWLLACCPEDLEAWLWFARLTPNLDERLAFLRRAYALHPDSARLRFAIRQAREEQLTETVGELKPWQARVRCLPDDRRVQRDNGNGKNGSSQHVNASYAKALRLRFRFGRRAERGSDRESSS